MRNRFFAILLISVLLVVIGSSCAGSGSTAPQDASLDGATLFKQECGKCHLTSVVEKVSLDAQGWENMVDKMVAKGAALNDEEKALVTEYLIEEYGK